MKFTSIAAALAISASASTVTADPIDTVAKALRQVQLGIHEADASKVTLKDNVIELIEGFKTKLEVGYDPMIEKIQKGKDDAWILIYGTPVQRGDGANPDDNDDDEDDVKNPEELYWAMYNSENWIYNAFAFDHYHWKNTWDPEWPGYDDDSWTWDEDEGDWYVYWKDLDVAYAY